MAAIDAICTRKNGEVSEASPCPEQLDVSIRIPVHKFTGRKENDGKSVDNSQQRGQWLRAAVLGANDGLVTIASLMIGVGAVQSNAKTVVVSGLAALVAGACSMAIGEFVSVYAQRDAEVSNMKIRVNNLGNPNKDESLPKPLQAAIASALAFSVGGVVPLLSAAFITGYAVRVGVLAFVSSVTLASFGAIGAYYGRSPVVKGTLRVLIGGWMAMLVTFGLLKLFATIAG
jgi:VIT1/CCC1 family predicted Fe2+/Mn2+ transporter